MYLDGLGMVSIANRLTDRGYRKDTTFSSHFVKGVLDTPVYMVKIAYDRRRTEKARDRTNAQIDPSELESELKGLEVTRRQTNARIRKISEQMDALDALDDMYDRKSDMQDRLDAAYKDLSRVEKGPRRIDAKLQNAIRRKATLFDAVQETSRMLGEWASHSEQERQEIFRKYIESVEIYPDVKNDARVVKRIVFKFPFPSWASLTACRWGWKARSSAREPTTAWARTRFSDILTNLGGTNEVTVNRSFCCLQCGNGPHEDGGANCLCSCCETLRVCDCSHPWDGNRVCGAVRCRGCAGESSFFFPLPSGGLVGFVRFCFLRSLGCFRSSAARGCWSAWLLRHRIQ